MMVRYIIFVICAVAALVLVGAWLVRQNRQPPEEHAANAAPAPRPAVAGESTTVRLSRQARENLGLKSQPLMLSNYWRTIDLPGEIVDRPGISDRGVVAPITGVITKIDRFPGDTVRPGEPLFSIRLLSESLHASQMELFKATQEIKIARAQLARLSGIAESGALPRARVIEIENEIKRLNVAVEAYRQDLISRGLSPEDIASAAQGKFVTEIVVRAPTGRPSAPANGSSGASRVADDEFEVHSLQVELGEQVESGELLAQLADHRALFIEGRAFKDDMPLVQQAAKHGWKVDVDFGGQEEGDWPASPEQLPIHHVANAVDSATRTFAFYLALENQSQSYSTPEGDPRKLWRFRPGGRVRLRVRVEEIKDVFVVPRAAVVREGPEAFVFRQNGDLFDRRPVHVIYEDRVSAALANDGSVRPGFFIAQNAAASLNRVLKAQSASGMPANVHIHADGTVHEAH